MARDFRHGHGMRKQQFQRKSQQKNVPRQANKSSVPMVWAAGFLISAALLIGFFITQHFISQANQSDGPTEKSIFIAAKEMQQKAVESVEEVSEKLQPKPVEVEAVQIEPEEKLVEPSEAPKYSFYDGLGKMEVVVDAVPISIQLEQPYYIQAGTFGSEKVALSEQKRLAKLGQELEMSVLYGKKRTYYRLRVGPFHDRLELNKRRNELRRLGVDTLLVKAAKVQL